MTQVQTNLLNTRERARLLRFEPVGAITQVNVQKAIEQAATQSPVIAPTSITVASSPYTVQSTDNLIYVDTSGGAVTILLQASAARLGVPLTIKDVTGNALTNNVTITPNGAEVIDGLSSYPLNFAYAGVRLNPRTSSYTVAP